MSIAAIKNANNVIYNDHSVLGLYYFCAKQTVETFNSENYYQWLNQAIENLLSWQNVWKALKDMKIQEILMTYAVNIPHCGSSTVLADGHLLANCLPDSSK